MSKKNSHLALFIMLFLSCGSLFGEQRILVGSPIRQKPAILRAFLDSLMTLEQTNCTLDFCFIDDNVSEESRLLLERFAQQHKGHVFLSHPDKDEKSLEYFCNETTHYWKNETVWKVAAFKDRIIEYARDLGYDYLFLIDSDIVLHPKTINLLLLANKEIVSNIFWTSWSPGAMPQPQVWVSDEYTQYEKKEGESLTDEEAAKRFYAFIEKLKKPGIYEVGGLGACTLISRSALEKPISFKKIKNLSFWGEDRHFCIRAAALGIELFVDTHFPAYHIYRESDLAGVEEFKKQCGPKLTLAMVIRDEADRYLRPVLEAARNYITNAVIIDDASQDNSSDVCREILHGIPLRLIKNLESKFANEVELRRQLWEEIIQTNPEWILVLDADEIFEAKFKDEIRTLLTTSDVDLYFFRLYDFWDEQHYRDDCYWSAHQHYYPLLIRYNPEIDYKWKETPQHCGRFPLEKIQLRGRCSDLRLKHYGWAKPEDRLEKYFRYVELDPDGKFGWKEQYNSILDEHPNLVAWRE